MEISVFGRFFDQKKPNAESGILSGYFSQNIPSHDFGFGFKSNWHDSNTNLFFAW
jgi:hypothetical protein